MVDGVVSFVAGCVSGLAVCGDVQYHQALLRYGGMHACGLAHDGYVYAGQKRNDGLNSILAADLFFGRSQIDEVIGLMFAGKFDESVQKCNQAGPVIIASQSIQTAVFQRGFPRVFLPSAYRLHGVNVGIQKQSGFVRIKVGGNGPKIATMAFDVKVADFSHVVIQKL